MRLVIEFRKGVQKSYYGEKKNLMKKLDKAQESLDYRDHWFKETRNTKDLFPHYTRYFN